MSTSRRALVLHLVNGGEPVFFALSDEGATDLDRTLNDLMAAGGVHAPALADGTTAVVNFAHVATAHLDELPPHVRVYGSGQRQAAGL